MASTDHPKTIGTFLASRVTGDNPTRPCVLVAAFEGWNDAGSAATDAVRRLVSDTEVEHLATVGDDDYYDYQFTRPRQELTTTGTTIRWPQTDLFKVPNPQGKFDLVVALGVEPTFSWRAFCAEIIEVAQDQNVQLMLGVGALLADVPHTRPVPCLLNTNDKVLQDYFGYSTSSYEGPAGIPSVLGHECSDAGIPSLSLWAQLSHYVSQSPSPRVQLALAELIDDLLPWELPLDQLREDALAWQHGVEELAASEPEIARYVTQLEEASDAQSIPEASGESIAREFERYLRRRSRYRGEGPDQDPEGPPPFGQ